MNNQDKTPEGITPNLPLWSYQIQQNSKLSVKTRKDLEIHLITRALKDEVFREELVANPKAVVEKEIGAKLPGELEIKVLEETENTLYMVLPCNPYEGISEEKLKASVGVNYEDVAQWVLEQQRNTLLDEKSSVRLIVLSWKDKLFKQKFMSNPFQVIEQELGQNVQQYLQGIQPIVLAETTNTYFIVLPNVLMPSEQLTSVNTDINMPMVIGASTSLRLSCVICGK